MKIESLEINLLKASEIKDGDVILVKIDEETKSDFSKEKIELLYKQIKEIVKKEISIYFFPKKLSINIIKTHINNIEKSKNQILKNEENKNEKI